MAKNKFKKPEPGAEKPKPADDKKPMPGKERAAKRYAGKKKE